MTYKELAELDLAVAKAEGKNQANCDIYGNGRCYFFVDERDEWEEYQPTRDPAEAMRLLVKHRMEVAWPGSATGVRVSVRATGELVWQVQAPDELLIAICRAVVAMRKK